MFARIVAALVACIVPGIEPTSPSEPIQAARIEDYVIWRCARDYSDARDVPASRRKNESWLLTRQPLSEGAAATTQPVQLASTFSIASLVYWGYESIVFAPILDGTGHEKLTGLFPRLSLKLPLPQACGFLAQSADARYVCTFRTSYGSCGIGPKLKYRITEVATGKKLIDRVFVTRVGDCSFSGFVADPNVLCFIQDVRHPDGAAREIEWGWFALGTDGKLTAVDGMDEDTLIASPNGRLVFCYQSEGLNPGLKFELRSADLQRTIWKQNLAERDELVDFERVFWTSDSKFVFAVVEKYQGKSVTEIRMIDCETGRVVASRPIASIAAPRPPVVVVPVGTDFDPFKAFAIEARDTNRAGK